MHGPSDATASAPVLRDSGVDLLTEAFAQELHAETALLATWAQVGGLAQPCATWGLDGSAQTIRIRPDEGFVGRVLTADQPLVERLGPGANRDIARTPNGTVVTHGVGAPVGGLRAGGALCAGLVDEPDRDPAEVAWIASSYAALAGLCLSGSGALGSLLEAARHDSLTGCLDHGAIRDSLCVEVSRCERHGRALACCFVDLDDFKRVNDGGGHLHGDRVLAAVAGALRDNVRTSDVVARYGGDEFVIVLPETGSEVAMVLANRLREQVTAATGQLGDPVHASVGISEWRPDDSADDILERADAALRLAKGAGGGIAIGDPPKRRGARRSRSRSRS